jgi:hypothetical protein
MTIVAMKRPVIVSWRYMARGLFARNFVSDIISSLCGVKINLFCSGSAKSTGPSGADFYGSFLDAVRLGIYFAKDHAQRMALPPFRVPVSIMRSGLTSIIIS